MKAFLTLLPFVALVIPVAVAAPVQEHDNTAVVFPDLAELEPEFAVAAGLAYVPDLLKLHDLLGAVKAVDSNISMFAQSADQSKRTLTHTSRPNNCRYRGRVHRCSREGC